MRVLVLPKYGRRGASSRLRYFQYLPYLESRGIDCHVSSLFDDDYVARRSQRRGRAAKVAGMAHLLKSFLQRARAIRSARQYDLVFMHCEAFPYLPPLLERQLASQKVPYLVDYDDAIFHNYDLHKSALVRRVLGNKIAEVLQRATGVIAGSEYLAEYARRVNQKVWTLPTVIDLERYPANRHLRKEGEVFTVGWIGSFSTMPYLHLIEDAVGHFCRAGKSQLIVIGAGKIDLPVSPLECREWSEATEVNECLGFDVGIMPVPDTPWARGKCGYKLIQYMACGLPVIASPVGVNADLVAHGKNGFLADSTAEWQNALEALYCNPIQARQMGEEGRRRVEEQYCLQVTAPRLERIMRECASTA